MGRCGRCGSDGHPPARTRGGGGRGGGPPGGTHGVGGGTGVPPVEPATVVLRGRFSQLLTSSPGGTPVPPIRCAKLASTATALLLLATGCGEGGGVAEDATVSVYVSAPLCAGAKQELARNDGRAGDFKVRAICADDTGNAELSSLAAIGAAARRATEDSSSVAYIGTADPVAMRFSEPILDEADIPRISADSGEASMTSLLRALQRADDSGSLRESLADELQ